MAESILCFTHSNYAFNHIETKSLAIVYDSVRFKGTKSDPYTNIPFYSFERLDECMYWHVQVVKIMLQCWPSFVNV